MLQIDFYPTNINISTVCWTCKTQTTLTSTLTLSEFECGNRHRSLTNSAPVPFTSRHLDLDGRSFCPPQHDFVLQYRPALCSKKLNTERERHIFFEH